ncbi:MAG: hypothetical protein KKH94_06015, partial [Candidatus Omnitrophica bacterium]|nr:hypothetical protein [Candidatus Omnitrophota bacterium]
MRSLSPGNSIEANSDKKILSFSMMLTFIYLGIVFNSAVFLDIKIVYIAACIFLFPLIYRSSVNAVIAILYIITIHQLLGRHPFFSIGEFNIFLSDALIILFTAIIGLRLLTNRRSMILFSSRTAKSFLMLSLLIIISLLRGLMVFGQSAIVQSRHAIFFVVATLYFGTSKIDKKELRSLMIVFIVYGVMIALVAYLRIFNFIPRFEHSMKYQGVWIGDRVLDRNGVFVMVIAYFVLLTYDIWRISKRYILTKKIAIILLLIAIIMCQIRTMWILAGIGTMVIILKHAQKGIYRIGMVMFSIVILIGITWLYNPVVILKWSNNLYSASAAVLNYNESTFFWRIQANVDYLKNMSLKDCIIGVKYGTPIYFADAGLHNMYIDQLYRTGIFGLIFFVLLQIGLIRRIKKSIVYEDDKVRRCIFYILWIILLLYQIYFMAWTFDMTYSVVLGISLFVITH